MLMLSAASDQTNSVNFASANGTATLADNDFQSANGTVTWLPGELTKIVTVLVNGDVTFEANEAFTVHLSSAVNASISVCAMRFT